MKYTIEQIQQIYENETIKTLFRHNGMLYLQYYKFNLSPKKCLYIITNIKRASVLYPE